jgi:hypothetical protein
MLSNLSQNEDKVFTELKSHLPTKRRGSFQVPERLGRWMLSQVENLRHDLSGCFLVRGSRKVMLIR